MKSKKLKYNKKSRYRKNINAKKGNKRKTKYIRKNKKYTKKNKRYTRKNILWIYRNKFIKLYY